MVFQKNHFEKAYFIAKMSALAIVRPASSDFWKAPLRERRMHFAGHCWRAKQELASDLLLWSPNHGNRWVPLKI